LSAKILVTGGTGFVGAYIIKALVEKGYRVRALRRNHQLPFFIPTDIFEKVEWVEGDILDVVSLQQAMSDIDVVIHAAAVVSFQKKERERIYRVNIDGTMNVVNMALEQKIKRFVHISSVASIGRTKNEEFVTEDKKWQESKINTHYAISKHRAEMEVWRGMAEGLPAVIINPSTVIGFGDWNKSSSAIFKNVYNNIPWYTKGINGFVDVEDVAAITVALMETMVTGERFIVSAENWSFQKLLNTIADGFGRKHPSKEATPLLGELAWRIEKIKSLFTGNMPLLTKESARVAHSQAYFDNSKVLGRLPGFSFTTLEQSIFKTCKKYLEAINAQQL